MKREKQKIKSKRFLHSLRPAPYGAGLRSLPPLTRWRAGGMTVACVLFMSACMPGIEVPDFSLASEQPTVVEVRPVADEVVSADASVTLSFSVPLDPESLTKKSIAVIFQHEDKAVEDVVEDVIDGETQGWGGALAASDDGLNVTFQPNQPYPAGAALAVVVTSQLMSTEHIPFNQTPGETPTPFISAFTVEGSAAASESASSDADNEEDDEVVEVPKIRPSWLVISEVLYDVTGVDTNGDLFIELAGEKNTEISGYKVNFVNGGNGKIYDDFKLPDGAFIPDDGVYLIADAITGSPGATNVPSADFVVNFDPQNGPDAIQLVDDQGALVDALGYGIPIVAFAENGLASYESSPAQDVGSNMSLARVDTFDTDDNSLDFIQRETPSPGVVELMHE